MPKGSRKPKASRRKPAKIATHRVYVPLKINVWVSPVDKRIRIVAPGRFISTISDRPGARYHAHLYSKLRTVLRNRGKWLA